MGSFMMREMNQPLGVSSFSAPQIHLRQTDVNRPPTFLVPSALDAAFVAEVLHGVLHDEGR